MLKVHIFLNEAKDLPFSLTKKKLRVLEQMPRTCPRTLLLNSLAPAKHQARASSLILAMIAFVVEWWWWKTLGLRSFQTSQEMSITKHAKAFLC
jgi:hypothetical protein